MPCADAPGRRLQAPSSPVAPNPAAPSPAVPGGGCACIENFAPVCASGTQYENECRACCDNVTEFTRGPCPAAAPAKGVSRAIIGVLVAHATPGPPLALQAAG